MGDRGKGRMEMGDIGEGRMEMGDRGDRSEGGGGERGRGG